MAIGEFSNPTFRAHGAAAGKHLSTQAKCPSIEEVCPAPTFRIFQRRTCQRSADAGKTVVIASNLSIPNQTTPGSSTSARSVRKSTDAPKQIPRGSYAAGTASATTESQSVRTRSRLRDLYFGHRQIYVLLRIAGNSRLSPAFGHTEFRP